MRTLLATLAISSAVQSTEQHYAERKILEYGTTSAGFFDYTMGGENWQDEFPDSICGTGTMQSPIDLDRTIATTSPDIAIQLDGYMGATKDPLMDGERMETNWEVMLSQEPWAASATLTQVDANVIEMVYMPVGLQIHQPSEHTVNGRLSDAELQIYHVDDMGNMSVVGILLDRTFGNEDNAFIESVFSAYRTRDEEQDWKEMADLSLLINEMLHTSHIWQYEGSLTVPPCTEGIVWNMIAEVQPISRRQLEMLATFTQRTESLKTNSANPYNSGGNNRAVQPLNERMLFIFEAEEIQEPDPERDSKGLYEYQNGGEDWPELYPDSDCGIGMNQSPIDLIPSMARTDPDIAIKLLNYDTVMAIKDPLEQSSDPDSLVKESETNWDVSFSGVNELADFIRRDADGAVFEFKPAGVHLHAPSEHTVNGKLYDAEFHIVHADAAGNLSVLGILFDRMVADQDSPFVMNVLDAHDTRDLPVEERVALDLTTLINKHLDTTHLYQYDGSLTTPPCSEGVRWNVLAQPQPISTAQLERIAERTQLGPELASNTANPGNVGGNNRAIQPLNGREVTKAGPAEEERSKKHHRRPQRYVPKTSERRQPPTSYRRPPPTRRY